MSIVLSRGNWTIFCYPTYFIWYGILVQGFFKDTLYLLILKHTYKTHISTHQSGSMKQHWDTLIITTWMSWAICSNQRTTTIYIWTWSRKQIFNLEKLCIYRDIGHCLHKWQEAGFKYIYMYKFYISLAFGEYWCSVHYLSNLLVICHRRYDPITRL